MLLFQRMHWVYAVTLTCICQDKFMSSFEATTVPQNAFAMSTADILHFRYLRMARNSRISDLCLATVGSVFFKFSHFFSRVTVATLMLILDCVQPKINTCLHVVYECV